MLLTCLRMLQIFLSPLQRPFTSKKQQQPKKKKQVRMGISKVRHAHTERFIVNSKFQRNELKDLLVLTMQSVMQSFDRGRAFRKRRDTRLYAHVVSTNCESPLIKLQYAPVDKTLCVGQNSTDTTCVGQYPGNIVVVIQKFWLLMWIQPRLVVLLLIRIRIRKLVNTKILVKGCFSQLFVSW